MKKFELCFWNFIIFAIIGWVYEELYYIFCIFKLTNCGTMIGPWLPIYGSAGLLIYLISKKINKNPIKMFAITFVLSGIIEYCTSYYLEKVYHMRWWDYSEFAFNLNGRICLLGLLVFSLLGVFVMMVILPFTEKIYNKMNVKLRRILIYSLFILFSIDFIYSTFHPNINNAKPIKEKNNKAVVQIIEKYKKV